jgi:hypothetical protein
MNRGAASSSSEKNLNSATDIWLSYARYIDDRAMARQSVLKLQRDRADQRQLSDTDSAPNGDGCKT